MKKPDYELKAKVLNLGLHLVQKQVSIAKYAYYALIEWGVVVKSQLSFEEALQIEADYLSKMPLEWAEACKINHAFYERVKRLTRRIGSMLKSGNCIFLTFTFTDDVLARTTADTRRQKVRRYLASYGCPYVANIDFGAKNGREHYHALIQAESVDYSLYNYGAINGEKVKSVDDNVKLAKYISKLTNHAIKETTARNVVIYSRD